jgi:hypothetical protein
LLGQSPISKLAQLHKSTSSPAIPRHSTAFLFDFLAFTPLDNSGALAERRLARDSRGFLPFRTILFGVL